MQDIRRRISNCFVAADQRTGEVAAFYTLAAASVSLTELPLTITKPLPRYPVFPAIQIGRLAVDSRYQYQGPGVGSGLLADATLRSARAEPAAFTLPVDAKNDNAAAFYRKFGFSPFASRPLTLFLPITTALKLASDQLVKAK
jgi:ribosomal protein S18 acetylase RimI-like enzyme